MNRQNNYCVIMAGGIGSRFWPMSTTKFPKQFQDILGTGRTMLQQTYDRISQLISDENIFVITNAEYMQLCADQLPNIPSENIVGEPAMKNTAACNIYMASKISKLKQDANLIVLPADHLIIKEKAFIEKAEFALKLASENDYLITLGIQPTRPDTGYGYIQFDSAENQEFYKVRKFREKPDLETAKQFLASDDFLWNSGMFVWNVKAILNAFTKYLPEMTQKFSNCDYNSETEHASIDKIYNEIDKISIDNGILEVAENVYVIPADLGWSDLGTWNSVYENAEKDANGNSVPNELYINHESSGNIIRTEKNKAVVIDGLKDFIIIDTDKSLLICPRDHDQMIKNFVTDLTTLEGGKEFV